MSDLKPSVPSSTPVIPLSAPRHAIARTEKSISANEQIALDPNTIEVRVIVTGGNAFLKFDSSAGAAAVDSSNYDEKVLDSQAFDYIVPQKGEFGVANTISHLNIAPLTGTVTISVRQK